MAIIYSNQNGWIISHEECVRIPVIPVHEKCTENLEISSSVSVLLSNEHAKDKIQELKLNPNLFSIWLPFKEHRGLIREGQGQGVTLTKRKKQRRPEGPDCPGFPDQGKHIVEELSQSLIEEAIAKQKAFMGQDSGNCGSGFCNHSEADSSSPSSDSNSEALQFAQDFFHKLESNNCSGSKESSEFHGQNNMATGIITKMDQSQYVIPPNTSFYCYDIDSIEKHLNGQLFDLIVMDPPWRNKYIRRRKRKQAEAGYQLLENCQIQEIPIEMLTNENALVVVWCTNSKSHQLKLIHEFFPKWGVQLQEKFYWLKVTKKGQPITAFQPPISNLKQPFETIIIGRRNSNVSANSTATATATDNKPEESSKVIISVPSSINSHKPPLIAVLEDYFKINTNDLKCCELFARSLLSGWTSYGNEVLKLQSEGLFVPLPSTN